MGDVDDDNGPCASDCYSFAFPNYKRNGFGGATLVVDAVPGASWLRAPRRPWMFKWMDVIVWRKSIGMPSCDALQASASTDFANRFHYLSFSSATKWLGSVEQEGLEGNRDGLTLNKVINEDRLYRPQKQHDLSFLFTWSFLQGRAQLN